MSEPEDVIVDAALHAFAAAQKLWQRGRATPIEGGESLVVHRRRLNFLVIAIYERQIPFRIAQPLAPASMLSRLFGKPVYFRPRFAVPASDDLHIFLPSKLEASVENPATVFRMLSLLQAAKTLRRSASLAPAPDSLARAFYEISEAFAAEMNVVQRAPGYAVELQQLRYALLAERPQQKLGAREAAAEQCYQTLLRYPHGSKPLPLPLAVNAQASRSWADEQAATIEQNTEGRFQGFLPDLYIGELRHAQAAATTHSSDDTNDQTEKRQKQSSARLQRRPEVREGGEEQDETPGPWMIAADEGQEHVEDPMGLERPTDRDTGDNPESAADSIEDLQEARMIASPERAKEVFVSDDPPDTHSVHNLDEKSIGIIYPEWDYRAGDYRPNGARVRLHDAQLGDPRWAEKIIAERRGIFETVRRRFEGLRPRRISLGRQRDGDELDLEAWVEAYADHQAGVPMTELLYRSTRPRRRDIAISLVIDVSASTDAWVSDHLRVVDVAKESLLLCAHALDALGDPYAISAFSGEGRQGVDIWSIKDFEERNSAAIQRRIAGLEPDNYTRAGAALRHAIAGLAGRREEHRLLILLSDGKPNDADEYGGRYGVEDTRQAILEATNIGIHSYCLTIDREGPDYLPYIFGPFQYTTLEHARSLPTALVEILRHLVRR